jgi:hypothetical protein
MFVIFGKTFLSAKYDITASSAAKELIWARELFVPSTQLSAVSNSVFNMVELENERTLPHKQA